MKKTSMALCAGLAMLGLPGAAQAADVLYQCEIQTNKRQRGWIPGKMHVVVKANGTVQILDGLLIAYDQSPKTARVTQNGATLVAHWTLESPTAIQRRNPGDYKYTLRLKKSDGQIKVSAVPASDPISAARVHGRGTCKASQR